MTEIHTLSNAKVFTGTNNTHYCQTWNHSYFSNFNFTRGHGNNHKTSSTVVKAVELSVYHRYFWNLLYLKDVVYSGFVCGSVEHVMKLKHRKNFPQLSW